MSNMASQELDKSVKLTQEVLGKYVKKPPLSEKNLARPPFRFIHDIVTSVHASSSGVLNGVFDPSELDPSNITTREAKTEFMKKLISAIKGATGEEIPVKISKILSGQEAEKTNQLLQSLGKAIEKSGGAKPQKPAVSKAGAGSTKKSSVDKKADSKSTPIKTDSKPAPTKKGATSEPASNNASKDLRGQKRNPAAPAKDKTVGTTSTKGKPKPSENVPAAPPARKDSKSDIKSETDNKSGSSSSIQRKNSNADQLGQVEEIDKTTVDNVKNQSLGAMGASPLGSTSDVGIAHDDHIELYNDFKNSSMNPNGETLPLPASPIIPDSSAMLSMSSVKVENHEDIPDFSPSLLDNKTASVSDFAKNELGGGDANESLGKFSGPNSSSDNVVASTSRNRPGTGTRISTARPPSARPAPPRPRSSMPKEAEESNYRPPTGKVTNVLLDSSDAVDDDDNFIIRETNVSKTAGLDDLDEAPELALTGAKSDDINLDDLDPGQRGLLVNQILESQKELESKNIDAENEKLGAQDFDSKSYESSKAEIEKLKTLIQDSARNANPLGKLLDYVREDVDAMQKEIAKWREESRQLDSDLENAKSSKESALQPLQQELHQMETLIADKEDRIAATKMSILRHQERIEKILSGLDRVQSSHGKISLPTASELMEHEPQAIRNDDLDYQNGHSSGFGTTLNRLAKSSAGMRPISLFAASDDLDPDNFDPFKM